MARGNRFRPLARLARRIWQRSFVATFLTGLFTILPIAITVAIMSWVGGLLGGWVGPGTRFGNALDGLTHTMTPRLREFVSSFSETAATFMGWLLVLVGIWVLGFFVQSFTRDRASAWLDSLLGRIPLLKTVYRPVSQVVELLKPGETDSMKAMTVIYCDFGSEGGGGFLGLLAGPQVYQFGKQPCFLVYLPTSPVPMSGGIVFVPVSRVQQVEMEIDDLMQIYFSLGVMATKTVPEHYFYRPADAND